MAEWIAKKVCEKSHFWWTWGCICAERGVSWHFHSAGRASVLLCMVGELLHCWLVNYLLKGCIRGSKVKDFCKKTWLSRRGGVAKGRGLS